MSSFRQNNMINAWLLWHKSCEIKLFQQFILIYKVVGWKEIGVHTIDQSSVIIYLWPHQSIKKKLIIPIWNRNSDEGAVDVVHEKSAIYIYIYKREYVPDIFVIRAKI